VELFVDEGFVRRAGAPAVPKPCTDAPNERLVGVSPSPEAKARDGRMNEASG